MSASRPLVRIIRSHPTSDGAGVKLRRSLGARPSERLDPFLMLDEFYSDDPGDYLAGFPSHPHRGFETVTYMLDGHMRHEDHLGNQGDLGPGGVQWMTAGRGVIHSEMPQQTEGRMRGFQLWINLPAAEKMKPATYRDIAASEIPEVALNNGGMARIIAGTFSYEGSQTRGPVQGISTEPLFVDLRLPAGGSVSVPLAPGHNALVYAWDGSVRTAGEGPVLGAGQAGLLSTGDQVTLQAGDEDAGILLLAARPLGEPVVQYGPFVMNTREEIEQALSDYRTGQLTA